MGVFYRIEVFQEQRSAWRDLLKAAIRKEIAQSGVHRSLEVEVAETHAGPGTAPVVAVALLSRGSATDPNLSSSIRAALDDNVLVIPVVDDLANFAMQAPPELTAFNAFAWSGRDPEIRLARILQEELGIQDRDRRVFISHRRSDGLGAAERLHDRLTHHRFRPFIDRFAIIEGADVQAEIADALEDYAFLLLLETPDAYLSSWVFDEVDYALAHTMGILIVQWPGNPTPVPGSTGLPRQRLRSRDLTRDAHGYEVLTDNAMDLLLQEIEGAHARGLVRRRRMLVINAQEAAENSGSTCVPLTNWCLQVTGRHGTAVVSVCPRLPNAHDLERLDVARERVAQEAKGIIMHAARRLPAARRSHLDWVVDGRKLSLVPENEIGVQW